MIEDSYERRDQAHDGITIPVMAWSDLSMASWSAAWAIRPTGNVGCVACAAEQASSRNYMPFIHEQNCRLKVDRTQQPWVLLKTLMTALRLEEQQQWSPF